MCYDEYGKNNQSEIASCLFALATNIHKIHIPSESFKSNKTVIYYHVCTMLNVDLGQEHSVIETQEFIM